MIYSCCHTYFHFDLRKIYTQGINAVVAMEIKLRRYNCQKDCSGSREKNNFFLNDSTKCKRGHTSVFVFWNLHTHSRCLLYQTKYSITSSGALGITIQLICSLNVLNVKQGKKVWVSSWLYLDVV